MDRARPSVIKIRSRTINRYFQTIRSRRKKWYSLDIPQKPNIVFLWIFSRYGWKIISNFRRKALQVALQVNTLLPVNSMASLKEHQTECWTYTVTICDAVCLCRGGSRAWLYIVLQREAFYLLRAKQQINIQNIDDKKVDMVPVFNAEISIFQHIDMLCVCRFWSPTPFRYFRARVHLLVQGWFNVTLTAPNQRAELACVDVVLCKHNI